MTGRKITTWMIPFAAVVCAATIGLDLWSPEAAGVAAYEFQVAEDAPGAASGPAGEAASSQPGSTAEEPANGAAGGEADTQLQHKPPIRLTTVDYQDAGEAAGKMKLAGTADAGTTVYIYFDDQPLTNLVADGQGKWSFEGDMKLEAGEHTLRAEQYDEASGMLSGRASVTLARVPPAGAAPDGTAPAEPSTPQPTTP